jgi:hypothetical protein
MALADFLDFKGDTEFELFNQVWSADELKALLGLIERALREGPGIMDCFSADEKEALSMDAVRALQKAGLLSARFYH